MKVLVVGAEGQLGIEICKVFSGADLDTADLDGAGHLLDICDAEGVNELIGGLSPEVVINTAGAINVPQCEADPGWAFKVNATGARNLAVACQAARARLVHISTDYVFGPGASGPLPETALPAPVNVYGASKLAGEHLIASECADHAIVRTAAIYGPEACRAKDGMNFVRLMLHLAKTQDEVKVVTDEITTPTYTVSLAEQIKVIALEGAPGLYHATCGGECSWHAFAKAIFEETKADVELKKATEADFPSPVKRPPYSVLQNAHLQAQGLDIMPPWRDALKDYLEMKPPV